MPLNKLLILVGWLVFMIVLSGNQAQDTGLTGAFVAATPAEQDRIILYGIDSPVERVLSMGDGLHNVWDFSPDGCRVLFTLTRPDGLAQAYTAQLDGSDIQPVVNYSALSELQWGIWEPDWSPDGSRIAFTMLRDGFERSTERLFHIGWVPPEGGEPTFYSVTGREHTPLWSPDGAWLTYVSFDERVIGPDPFSTAEPTPEVPAGEPTPDNPLTSEADIWIVSADADTKYRLTGFNTGNVAMPRWSPDGERLAFVFSPNNNNDTFWAISRAQGSNPIQLSYQWSLALDLTWLPDGSQLLAAARDLRDVPQNRLWQIPLSQGGADDGAELYFDRQETTYADYPRFSSDGRYLALRASYALVVLDATTGAVLLNTTETPGNTPPVWSPPGFTGEDAC